MTLDDNTKAELVNMLKEALKEAVETHPLSDEEIQWVRMAIEAEAQRAAFRKAVIEKTLVSLMGSMALGLAYMVWDSVKTHWK